MFLSLLDLFLRLFYTLFSMNQNHEEILYPQWSSPILYPTAKVQNSVMFSPIMSTKCNRFSWILFADQKRNIQLKPFFFSSPLFDLTLLPVYIITVIKVKLRVELYLFLLASKIVLWYDECMSNNLHLILWIIYCL